MLLSPFAPDAGRTPNFLDIMEAIEAISEYVAFYTNREQFCAEREDPACISSQK